MFTIKISKKHLSLISSSIETHQFDFVDYKSIRDNIKMLFNILNIIKKTKPDIVHVQGFGFKYFYLLLPFLRFNSKMVNTAHDVIPHSGDIDGRFYKLNNWLVNLMTNQLIVHGEVLKIDAQNYFKINKNNINVIKHGNLSIYKNWRKKSFTKNKNYILFFFWKNLAI